MEKDRGMERLIFFTDAVTAIAITLLILPLVDIVTTDADKHLSVESFLHNNLSQMFAFVLSFVVIARLWTVNHELLADTQKATRVLIGLDIAWVFTVVVLPLPTEITAAFETSRLTVGIYIGNTVASTLLLSAMCIYLYRRPDLQKAPLSLVQVWGVTSTTIGFILALIFALLISSLGYYALLIPLVTVLLDRILKPRIRKREAAKAPK